MGKIKLNKIIMQVNTKLDKITLKQLESITTTIYQFILQF